jgi:hypothetical protein
MKTTDTIEALQRTLKHKCNLEVLNYLTTFKTRRKVTIGGQQFLSFVGNIERDTMFLPISKRSRPSSLVRCSDEMLEFYSAFDGLREQRPPMSGHFARCARIETLGEILEVEDFPAFRKYGDRPIIFSAANGDQLIQTSDGSFAWCGHEESKQKKVASDFAKLLAKYMAYRRVGDGRPFDSYGR